MQALLEATAIAAGYNGKAVISDFSLTANPGDFLGLIGPNGSGKSTLIRVLSRVLPPLSGTALLAGEDIWKKGAAWAARRMAVIPQDSPLAFDFSVLEIVLMGRAPHLGRFALEAEKDLTIAWESLRLTNSEALANKPANALSGGEKQRVIISRALAQQPRILLADEPIAHLDINHQLQILELLQRLANDQNILILAALHDLNLAAAFCDRLLLLSGGRTLSAGSPAEVITSENIRRAYGVPAQVKINPGNGRPYLTLAGNVAPPRTSGGEGIRVHVICGAGSGAELLEYLAAVGCEVSAGVLNVTDSDQQVAERLNLPRVEEAPFSDISPEAHKQNCDLARAADVVVVCSIPFGHGNSANLEAAKAALLAGRKVLLAANPPIEARDFTGGEASRIYRDLISLGARTAEICGPELLTLFESFKKA
jgi:iron complex transport system ATP-binding protein